METREGWIIEDIGANDVYAVSAPDDAAFCSAMLAARASIAALRAQKSHLTAGIQRDVMMSAAEAWLDPGAGVFRAELQAEQRSLSAESARAIDPEYGF